MTLATRLERLLKLAWFRHQGHARQDARIRALGHAFGPGGQIVWWNLNEYCCEENGPLSIPGRDYDLAAKLLDIQPEWGIHVAEVLNFLVTTGLVRRWSNGAATSWEPSRRAKYNPPASATVEAQRDRKRRSRAGLSRDSHANVTTPNDNDDVNDNELPKPPPPSASDDVGFKSFWEQYPKRNGKKIGKAKTASSWKRLSKEQRERALIAVGHYADACNQGLTLAKDPERFLKADFFEDWLTPAQPSRNNGKAESVPDYVNVTGT